MRSSQPFRCYRCHTITRYVSTDSGATETGELTVSFECPGCGQRYELQIIPIAIFAITPDGEALATLHYCPRCGQLYRSPEDEPHLCRGEEVAPLDAHDEEEGT